MANVEKISIALPREMAASVREAVEKGEYASTSEVVREALRAWKLGRAVDQELVEELRHLWAEGLESGASEPLDMAAIKREARARLEEKLGEER